MKCVRGPSKSLSPQRLCVSISFFSTYHSRCISKNVYEGFLYTRTHAEVSHTIPVRIGNGVFGTMSVKELDAARDDERLEPIAKRAWTIQEQLRAQRTLTFTSRTMTWRWCSSTRTFGESLYFPHDLDSGYNDNDDKYSLNLHALLPSEEEAEAQKDKALSCWLRLVTAYSLRFASVERDKLNAIAGIASHPSFSCSLSPRYFAGLWQYSLARQLTWHTSSWHRTLSKTDIIISKPVNYRAPSWSWVSIEGGVICLTSLSMRTSPIPRSFATSWTARQLSDLPTSTHSERYHLPC